MKFAFLRVNIEITHGYISLRFSILKKYDWKTSGELCCLEKIPPFSPALFLGLIDNISNLLLRHFLLIAKHYIFSCKLRITIPMVQVYTQLVMEIESQIAFDSSNLSSFREKWATFKQSRQKNNLIYTVG